MSSRRGYVDSFLARWAIDTFNHAGLHDRALTANGGKPLSLEQLERVGMRPAGLRSSSGRHADSWGPRPRWFGSAATAPQAPSP